MPSRSNRHSCASCLAGFLYCCFAMIVFAMAPMAAAEGDRRDPQDHFFEQNSGNLAAELQTAKDDGKLALLIMLDSPECPWCDKMKDRVLNRRIVQEYYRKYFRVLRIEIEHDTVLTNFEGQEMPQKDFVFEYNRIFATPVFLFFDLEGKPLVKYTGIVDDTEEFLWLAEFVAEGHYRNGQRFFSYRRQKMEAVTP